MQQEIIMCGRGRSRHHFKNAGEAGSPEYHSRRLTRTKQIEVLGLGIEPING
jgi:hypothetical protein